MASDLSLLQSWTQSESKRVSLRGRTVCWAHHMTYCGDVSVLSPRRKPSSLASSCHYLRTRFLGLLRISQGPLYSALSACALAYREL